MTADEKAEERAFEEALLRLLEEHRRAAAKEPLTHAETEAFGEAVRRLMEGHRAHLERKGIDVGKALEEMTANLTAVQTAQQKQAKLRRELNKHQAGPYGDVRYHG